MQLGKNRQLCQMQSVADRAHPGKQSSLKIALSGLMTERFSAYFQQEINRYFCSIQFDTKFIQVFCGNADNHNLVQPSFNVVVRGMTVCICFGVIYLERST